MDEAWLVDAAAWAAVTPYRAAPGVVVADTGVQQVPVPGGALGVGRDDDAGPRRVDPGELPSPGTGRVLHGASRGAVDALGQGRAGPGSRRSAPDGPTVAVPSVYTAAAIAAGLAVTVVLGVLPQPVLDLADSVSRFVS